MVSVERQKIKRAANREKRNAYQRAWGRKTGKVKGHHGKVEGKFPCVRCLVAVGLGSISISRLVPMVSDVAARYALRRAGVAPRKRGVRIDNLRLLGETSPSTSRNYDRARKRRNREQLADSYLKKLICNETSLSFRDIPPELVALKREELTAKRLLREYQ
jgi:hypothetical protein